MTKEHNEKIDFVITWVDGNDPMWQKEKAKYKKNGSDDIKRFREWGLLRYWFRSIEKNAPFVNKIFFVTYGHYPSWLNLNNDKLVLIKHSDFIPKKYLPTFNSVAIEMNLHRIKGLSEKFVYFNDDMFLLSEVTEKNFFKGNKALFNMNETAMASYGGIDHVYRNMILNTNEIINKNFQKKPFSGLTLKDLTVTKNNLRAVLFKKYIGFSPHHSCRPFLKQTFDTAWKKEATILEQTSLSKFRNSEIITPDLIELWQYSLGKTEKYSQTKHEKYFNLGKDNICEIKQVVEQKKYNVVCLNDECSERDFKHVQEALIQSFEKIFPKKSGFEK